MGDPPTRVFEYVWMWDAVSQVGVDVLVVGGVGDGLCVGRVIGPDVDFLPAEGVQCEDWSRDRGLIL